MPTERHSVEEIVATLREAERLQGAGWDGRPGLRSKDGGIRLADDSWVERAPNPSVEACRGDVPVLP